MSPLSAKLIVLPILLSLATAIPTILNARDDHPSGTWTCGPGCSHTVFDDTQATCATDKTLKSLSTTTTVAVQPDCDEVINTICNASDKLASASQPMTNLAHTSNTCEGHMLFTGTTADKTTMSYAACTQAFQSITETCMLMGDPSDHNSASVGKQFGVRNVFYQSVASGEDWTASNMWQPTMPGYLIGPPGVWGTTNWGTSQEANDVLNAPK